MATANVSSPEHLGALDWTYLAEGRTSVVFGCKQQGIVLRLRKERSISDSKIYNKDSIYDLQEQATYINEILLSLFEGDKYLLTPRIVDISPELLNSLGDKLNESRPDQRVLNLERPSCFGFVMPHLGYLPQTDALDHQTYKKPTIAVEIKPKWGFLSSSPTIKPHHLVKMTTCRYCMHQYVKLKNGKVSKLSSYCPLDLFSKSSCRVRKALDALFLNPQNNLRVFVDGELAYTGLAVKGRTSSLSDFEHSVQERLHLFLPGGTKTNKSVSFTDAIINILTEILINDSWNSRDPDKNSACAASSTEVCDARKLTKSSQCDNKSCRSVGTLGLLNKMVTLQQLGGMDIEDIYGLYRKKRDDKSFSALLVQLHTFSSPVWRRFVNNTKPVSQANKDNQVKDSSCMKGALEQITEENFESISQIQNFLVASTIKDCSIMITFKECSVTQRGSELPVVYDSITERSYSYQMKLVDLDPRPHNIIPHYFELDHSIVRNYIMETKGKNCCP